ncbi:hypothetical protein [Kamptonema formosum]|uniref:hypothetical protein n=1 Tax=Kamptonema formosum TaxID=331992 RepID=UPI000347B50D|nr:hypothetical protein [Oscillatoria sp. PCC 10802]
MKTSFLEIAITAVLWVLALVITANQKINSRSAGAISLNLQAPQLQSVKPLPVYWPAPFM